MNKQYWSKPIHTESPIGGKHCTKVSSYKSLQQKHTHNFCFPKQLEALLVAIPCTIFMLLGSIYKKTSYSGRTVKIIVHSKFQRHWLCHCNKEMKKLKYNLRRIPVNYAKVSMAMVVTISGFHYFWKHWAHNKRNTKVQYLIVTTSSTCQLLSNGNTCQCLWKVAGFQSLDMLFFH